MSFFRHKAVRILTWAVFLCIGATWVLYGLFGRQLIDFLYSAQSFGLVDKILAGRAFTPVEEYYRKADQIVFLRGLSLAVLYLFLPIAVRNPRGVFIAGCSLLFTSFLLFCVLEMFPSLIEPLRLHVISYYAYKATFVADDKLVFREKPFKRIEYDNFRGDHYSPIYGIEIAPVKVKWTLDGNGFRNCCSQGFSDIVVLGDSYMEYGHTDNDTFVGRLQEKLPGLKVTNLGVSGYGPPQYLEVMKRYGLKYEPRYALMAFFEGNDITDTKNYLRWHGGKREDADLDLLYVIPEKSFFSRFWLVLRETRSVVGKKISREAEIVLGKLRVRGYFFDIHPDLALLNLPEAKYEKVLFVERLSSESPDELLKREEWQEVRRILADFRDICEKHHIVPLIMYIPTGAHIYAPYSTDRSGKNWLQIRDQQIGAIMNTEEAITRLVRELKIELISLTPIFETGARQGKLLYYQLDPHWNSEGRELAASFLADYLRTRYLAPHKKNLEAQHASFER